MSQTIVLLVLDSVRKDIFDEYASNLQRLADHSFERCYAPSSWSAPSHASMLTGTLPSEHGVHAHNIDLSNLDSEETFFSSVSSDRTVGISSNIFAGTPYGFDEYFDEFTNISRHSVFTDGLSIDEFVNESDQTGIRRYVDFLRKALDEGVLLESFVNGVSLKVDEATRGLPVPRFQDYGTRLINHHVESAVTDASFVFANLMEAHAPLRVSTKYTWSIQGNRLRWHSDAENLWEINNADAVDSYQDYLTTYRSVYAAAVEYLDRAVGTLVERVLAERDDVTFVVTADHGENLAYESERGILGHVGDLGDSLTHVPLAVINPPSRIQMGLDDLVSLLDLPELLECFAEGHPVSIDRKYAPAERVGLGLETEPDNNEFWDRMIRRVVRDDGSAVEWDSLGNVAVSGDGEREASDADAVPDWARKQFTTTIEEYKTSALSADTAKTVDDATEDRLKELGYL